jgi:hypothetical protein
MAAPNGSRNDPTVDEGVHDRELDAPLDRPSVRVRPASTLGYQRLVANPFLAVLGLIVWYAAVRVTVQARRLDLFFLALLSLSLVIFLFQYHCLDCGATGRLVHWRGHVCERIRLRAGSGQPRRFPALSPVAQTLGWIYLLAVGSVVWYIVTR